MSPLGGENRDSTPTENVRKHTTKICTGWHIPERMVYIEHKDNIKPECLIIGRATVLSNTPSKDYYL